MGSDDPAGVAVVSMADWRHTFDANELTTVLSASAARTAFMRAE